MNKIRQYIKDVLEKNPQAWMDGKSPLELFYKVILIVGGLTLKLIIEGNISALNKLLKMFGWQWTRSESISTTLMNLNEKLLLTKCLFTTPDSKKGVRCWCSLYWCCIKQHKNRSGEVFIGQDRQIH